MVKGAPSLNPSGRARRTDAAKVERADGWASVLTGHGTPGWDKRVGTRFDADIVAIDDAVELWRGDDLAARIVETIPSEMLRQGFEIAIGGDDAGAKDRAELLMTRAEELGMVDSLWHAMAYERAYGGGAIMLGAAAYIYTKYYK